METSFYNRVAASYEATQKVNELKKSEDAQKSDKTEKTAKNGYGKTVGEPKLSEKAAEYYKNLKKKFGGMDFILVSKDKMDEVKANSAKYGRPDKPVVLIDDEKVEKMANDPNYREKYETILTNAQGGLKEFKASLDNTPGVRAYGITVNDDGTASYFAVIDKSLEAQKERIEEKRAEKIEDNRKADRKEKTEKLDKFRKQSHIDEEETVTFTGKTVEEVLQKISDYQFNQMCDTTQTEEEKKIGQHVDFKG